MAVRLIYESGINGETTDITGYLPLYSYDMTEHAEEGSVALSSVTLDDPNGELDIVGWRRFWAYEDTATGSNSLMHYGWIGEKTVNRGTSRTGSGRLWTVSVADQNVVLGFRVLTAAQVNRPAETDVARVNWLMGFVDWFGRAPITVDEFTFDANAVQMDAVDYRGQTALDILSDCANQSGKNFYCYTKDNGYPASEPTRGIWYGSMAHTAYSSMLKLTNVAANIDNVLTFAISENTQLERKADRVYSGAYVRYDGGAVYEQNATTFNNFTQRDAVVEASNVKSSGAATRRATRYLADLNSEEDRITTSYYVPAPKVNFAKPGMRIQFQASHFTGYESFRWCRILSKQVAEVAETEEAPELKYLVTLVLAGDPGEAASECGDSELTQWSGIDYTPSLPNGSVSFPDPLGTCLQIWVEVVRGQHTVAPIPPTGFTQAGWAATDGPTGNNGKCHISYRITQPGDSQTVGGAPNGGDSAAMLLEFGGVNSFDDVVSASSQANASSIASGNVAAGGLIVGVFIKGGPGPLGGNTLPNLGISAPATQQAENGTISSGDQGPTIVVGYQYVSGSASMTATGDSGGFADGTWGYVVAGFS